MAAMDKLTDLVLENILARLPGESLLRCRCVSKHWKRLITDPYFMKSRARRRIIFLTESKLIDLVDDNENDPTHSRMLKLSYPYEPWRNKDYRVLRILGTINGIVLFLYYWSDKANLMLYNPFTRKYLLLPPANWQNCHHCVTTYAYGFGYGSAAPDDLKIVGFREYGKRCPNNICGTGVCEIFSLNEFTWSKSRDMNIKDIEFQDTAGTFLNGFLYWIPYKKDKLIVLDVAKLVLSAIHLPFKRSYNYSIRSHLGTIHGCLCLLDMSVNNFDFNLWVMNDQADANSWSIRCSFTLSKDVYFFHRRFICILDNGRILMRVEDKLHIYDPSDELYTLTDVSISTNNETTSIHGIEYVETLVSLSDVCSA